MKTHTNKFKEAIARFGREIDSVITYEENNTQHTLTSEDLNAVTPLYKGSILKSVMKQLNIESAVDIPLQTIVNYKFGVKVDGTYEYLDYGNYVVYKSEKQEDTNNYKITCYDKILYAMVDYESMNITYPITIRNYISAICTHLGLTFANANDTFTNYDKEIPSELYLTSTGESLNYTFRDVLDQLAEVTASTICINDNDEVEIRYINNTTSEEIIDEEYLRDVNVTFGKKFGPVNTVILSRADGSDKIAQSIPQDLADDLKIAIEIKDNQIMNFNDRDEYLEEILNRLNGLEYYLNDFVSPGIGYLDLCDRYSVQIGEKVYPCIMFNDEFNVTQGLSENIYSEEIEGTQPDYTKVAKTDRKVNQAYFLANKANGTAEAVVSSVGQNGQVTAASIMLAINNDTSQINIDADKININGVISANGSFQVDTNGNMSCSNANITGGKIFLTDDSGTGIATLFKIVGTNGLTNGKGYMYSTGVQFSTDNTNYGCLLQTYGENPTVSVYGNGLSATMQTQSNFTSINLRDSNNANGFLDIEIRKNGEPKILVSKDSYNQTNIFGDKITTPQIVAANIDCGSCTLNSNGFVTVYFNKTFATVPKVVVTPHTTVAGVIPPKVREVTTTYFTATIGGSISGNIDCDWIAIS